MLKNTARTRPATGSDRGSLRSHDPTLFVMFREGTRFEGNQEAL
jgi:hypothetical protein